MVVDIGEMKQFIKPKADSTLRNMRKDDLIEYIRCLEHNYNVAVSFNENQAKYIESLGVNAQKWIPVTERLPQEFVSVLVSIPSENPLPTVREAYLANGAWATKMAIFFMEEVTYWMPLPNPPKEVHADA